jgi:hypothetical protein
VLAHLSAENCQHPEDPNAGKQEKKNFSAKNEMLIIYIFVDRFLCFNFCQIFLSIFNQVHCTKYIGMYISLHYNEYNKKLIHIISDTRAWESNSLMKLTIQFFFGVNIPLPEAWRL